MSQRNSVLLALGATIACACSPGPPVESEASEEQQPFNNQYSGEPIHEQVTIEGLHFLKRAVRNYLAFTNANFDAVSLVGHPEAHFDDCYFAEASQNIRDAYDLAVLNAMDFPVLTDCENADDYEDLRCSESGNSLALDAFARVLHPLQDFYAHTNWVESGLTELAFPSDIPGNADFPILTPYTTLRGLRIVDGDPPPSWKVRGPAKDAVYPDLARVIVERPARQADEPGLVSGWSLTTGAEPRHCPKYAGPGPKRIYHDDISKDKDGEGRMFVAARALAVAQTTEEWCRLQRLVYERHGVAGAKSLCENWVDDPAAADQVCPLLDEEARCKSSLRVVRLEVREGSSAKTGDLNSDQIPDVAIAEFRVGIVRTFLSRGDLTFQSGPSLTIPLGGRNTTTAQLSVADVNGDNRDDVIGVTLDEWIVVWLQGQQGAFGSPVLSRLNPSDDVAILPPSGDFAIADFNRDGRADLAILPQYPPDLPPGTTRTDPALTLYFGTGDGAFASGVVVHRGPPHNRFAGNVVSADFNRDGHADLAYFNEAAGSTFVFLAPDFSVPAVAIPEGTVTLLAHDLNADGFSDLSMTSALFLNEGGTSFARSSTNTGAGSPIVGDFNGDHVVDIAKVDSFVLNVLPGTGNGSFLPARELDLGLPAFLQIGYGYTRSAADFDGDGADEMVLPGVDATWIVSVGKQSFR